MAGALSERIVSRLDEAARLYNRLVLVVGPTGSGKTRALREVGNRIGAMPINVGLTLTERMLEFTERQRILKLPTTLAGIVMESGSDVVLLDNLEALFDATLRQDPMRMLKDMSKNQTIVAAWSGTLEGDYLTYADPEHPDYRRYGLDGIFIETTNVAAQLSKRMKGTE